MRFRDWRFHGFKEPLPPVHPDAHSPTYDPLRPWITDHQYPDSFARWMQRLSVRHWPSGAPLVTPKHRRELEELLKIRSPEEIGVCWCAFVETRQTAQGVQVRYFLEGLDRLEVIVGRCLLESQEQTKSVGGDS